MPLQHSNPIIPSIWSVLKAHPEGLKEYDLLEALSNEPIFKNLGEGCGLPLFQKHFLIMNALYNIAEDLRGEPWQLEISALFICISPCETPISEGLCRARQPIAEYYLDWKNYDQTEEDVEAMLNSFWEKYAARDHLSESYAKLGLKKGASWELVVQQYRNLVKLHHPDQGGQQGEFMEIRAAYEVLKVARGL